MKRGLRWAAQLLLTALVTYFLFRALRVSFEDLRAIDYAKLTPRVSVLTLSVVLLLAAFSYHLHLWVRLLRQHGVGSLPFARAIRVFFLAQLGRYLPGKVWPIAGLAYLATREGLHASSATLITLLSQVWTLAGAGVVGAFYIGFGAPGRWLWTAALVVLVAAGTLMLLGNRTLNARLMALAARLGKGAPPSLDTPGPGTSLTWLGLYAVVWLLFGGAFCALWTAFFPLPLHVIPLALTAFPAAYLIGYLAIFAPAGIGVREAALAGLTAPVLGAADATALAVIARLWITGSELIPLVVLIPRRTTARVQDMGDG